MRSYMKVYFDFEEDTQALDDVEKGRLLLAMLRYAKDGTESDLTGNERFLFPVFKAKIDRDIDTYDVKVNNGSKGGRPKKQDEPEETENNQTKPNETENNLNAKTKDKRIKTEDKRQKTEESKEKAASLTANFEKFWNAYPRHENRKKAEDAFRKINPDDSLLEKMLDSIDKQRDSPQWKENGGQYIPHPTTWLNGKRWEDEVRTEQKTISNVKQMPTVPAQNYDQRKYDEEPETLEDIMRRVGAL